MVVRHVEVCRSAIVFPVSNTVSNHKALKVRDPLSSGLGLVDKVIESKNKLRHVDSGIRLS